MAKSLHVHVVDADTTRRAAVARELYANSIHAEIYESVDELIDGAPSNGAVLASADLASVDEHGLIEAMRRRARYLPVAFYSSEPSADQIVQAMLSGAIDFMEWPASQGELACRIERVARISEQVTKNEARKHAARQRVAALTTRERDVLQGLLEGESNKEMAHRLGLSPRTVEIHRANMLSRLGGRSTADAVRIGLYAGMLDDAADQWDLLREG